MSGFESPNYTQTPNDFFAMLPDMGDAELRVTLVMIRLTFGFHRDGFKLGISKLAAAAGLSRQGTLDGAKAAENRGTFKRSNPEAQTEAEWELVVPLNPVEGGINLVEGTPQPSRGQVGVKESIKKISKKGDLVDAALFFGKQAKEQKADKVEEFIQEVERGLHVNITRSAANQTAARRIMADGRSFGQWLTWCISDEWRAAHLYLYADLDKVWREYPQAFQTAKPMNPQGLEVGF